MAQPGSDQPPLKWIWDNLRKQYYYYDPQTKKCVYQNETPYRASPSSPRSPPATLNANYALQYATLAPENSNYLLNRQSQPQAQQTQTQDGNLIGALSSMAITSRAKQPSQAPAYPSSLRVVDVEDPRSFVRNRFATAPVEQITDPELYKDGIRAHRRLYATDDEESERLYSNYKLRGHKFFKFGRVFMILWSEPAGEVSGSAITNTVETSDRSIYQGAFGERVHSKVRRFIVIREAWDYCTACPIATYGGKGVSKTTVTKSDHAIIYTGRAAPRPKTHENPQINEPGMRPIPIRVIPDDPMQALDPMSRIDFGKVHTIQHNIKVRPFGQVHKDSQVALATQFANVWRSTMNFGPDLSTNAPRNPMPSASITPTPVPGSSRAPAAYASMNPASSSSRREPSWPIPEQDENAEDESAGYADVNVEDYQKGRHEESSTSAAALRQGYQMQTVESSGKKVRAPASVRDSSRVSTARSTHSVPTSSSGHINQPDWNQRVQGAHAAHRRLTDSGYTQQQASNSLINELMNQGRSYEEAYSEIHALLTGRPPP